MSRLVLSALMLLTITLAAAVPVGAQEDPNDACPALVEAALTATANTCIGIGVDQACYGSPDVAVTFVENSGDPPFEKDVEPIALAALENIAPTPLDLEAGTWGVAVLRAALEEHPVTFVLMGGVSLQNAAEPDEAEAAPEIEPVAATTNTRANIREAPVDGDVIETLDNGTPVDIIGLNAAGDWYQVKLADDTTAWIAAFLLNVSDTEAAAALPVTEVGAETIPAPTGPGLAQNFTFESLSEAPCDEATNALLVQSPDAEPATFIINALPITLHGTVAFTQTVDDKGADLLVVYLIDGELETRIGDMEVALTTAGQAFGAVLGEEAHLTAPSSEAMHSALQYTCRNAAAPDLLPQAIDAEVCDTDVAFLHTITATNDLDRAIVLWVDAEMSIEFEADETKTFPVADGAHSFELCEVDAEPGSADCGTNDFNADRVIDEDQVWLGWWPEQPE